MKHIRIEITANEHQQEELIALLDDYGPTGFEQKDESMVVYFDANEFDAKGVQAIIGGFDYKTSEVEERNWNEEWERSFQPVIVDDFCAVRADFHQPIIGVQHEIIITPKMSFGTGHHPTTYLMVQAMRGLEFTGKSVFDFGTGTGILAILAYKLGGSDIAAIDVDEWSVENAAENFERNDITGIRLARSTGIPDKMFDVILANINRNVILEYMPTLKKAVNPFGTILFSGLMVQDETVIVAAANQHQLSLEQRTERQGWIALRFVTTA